MPTALIVDTSADRETSRTRELTRRFAEAWRSRGADFAVVSRDLHAAPPPYLVTTAQHWAPHLRRGAEVPAELEAYQRELLDELLAADVVVLGVPMYNASIPATLSSWIDLIHVLGTTVPFDDDAQPMRGRDLVVLSARGGAEDPDDPDDGWESVALPLRRVFGPVGLGMTVQMAATTRTLAELVVELDPVRAAEELETARGRARELALSVCGGGSAS